MTVLTEIFRKSHPKRQKRLGGPKKSRDGLFHKPLEKSRKRDNSHRSQDESNGNSNQHDLNNSGHEQRKILNSLKLTLSLSAMSEK
jgi:hypothetical protein